MSDQDSSDQDSLVSDQASLPDVDIDAFVSDLGSTLHGYPIGNPYAAVDGCVYDLEDDLNSDTTVFWLLGVAASGPFTVWRDRRSDIDRARKALTTALGAFHDRAGACTHDSHPWDGGDVHHPDDPLGFIELIHEADEWLDDPEDEEPYDTSFTELWRCPVNLAAIARDTLEYLDREAPGTARSSALATS
ncbi:hypothetical protein [Streptomyces sp. NPDC017993]|uniref:hypothetical protein n=1 Tax=Streptomyces sp. NPDC017993 TaxID=3365027 RepID=UPI0037B72B1F